ncbi:MAG: tyrosine-type recombinase/integrase family protein, partial [Clostridia bacterium]|nr:tyrosine-type recombinase/integrase family protein [Clostridia bacterium]
MLFVDYIKEWLIRKKADVQLSTWEGYEIYVTRHIIPYFEPLGLNIDQVTPKHIQDYYESRLNCQRPDHKAGGLKPVSIKKHAPVLNQIFEAALIEELVLRNPVSVVPLPKQEKREPVGKFMTAEEAGQMLEAFEGHELQALIYVTLYYGLRRSEVLGLKWDAVDFESDTLKIQHTVVKQKTIIAKDSTKSMTSRRVYPLLKEVKKLLLELREKQKKDRIDFGSVYTETDYIFVWSDGKPYRPDYITRTFKKVLAQHGLPQMRFHDIRHPYVKHTTKKYLNKIDFAMQNQANTKPIFYFIQTSPSLYTQYQSAYPGTPPLSQSAYLPVPVSAHLLQPQPTISHSGCPAEPVLPVVALPEQPQQHRRYWFAEFQHPQKPFQLCTFPHQFHPYSTVQIRFASHCSAFQSAVRIPTVPQYKHRSVLIHLMDCQETIPSAFSAFGIQPVPGRRLAFLMNNTGCSDQPAKNGTYRMVLTEEYGIAHDGSIRRRLCFSAGNFAVSYWEWKSDAVFPVPYRKFPYPQWQDGDLCSNTAEFRHDSHVFEKGTGLQYISCATGCRLCRLRWKG